MRLLTALLLALIPLACATTHEEPPAPPAPPVDPAAFQGPARGPAPEVDLDAGIDAGNLMGDAESPGEPPPSTLAQDAGSDAQPAPTKRKH